MLASDAVRPRRAELQNVYPSSWRRDQKRIEAKSIGKGSVEWQLNIELGIIELSVLQQAI